MGQTLPKPGLRPFLPDDVPLLAAIFTASIEQLTGDDYSAAQQQAWMEAAEDEELGKRLAADLTLIATLEGSPVGFASLRGNDHIRIHAMEGQLFREVLIAGAERSGVHCSVWRERDLYALAAKQLQIAEAVLRKRLTALGDNTDGGWRAEHKAAALAAWMVLSS